jgi:hypothetical protein
VNVELLKEKHKEKWRKRQPDFRLTRFPNLKMNEDQPQQQPQPGDVNNKEPLLLFHLDEPVGVWASLATFAELAAA